jgi:hypothetical protein
MLGVLVNSIFSTKLAAVFHIILCSPVNVAAPLISLLGGAYEWQARGSVKDSSAPEEVRRGGGGKRKENAAKNQASAQLCEKNFFYFLRRLLRVSKRRGAAKRRPSIASPNGSDARRLRLEYLFMFSLK